MTQGCVESERVLQKETQFFCDKHRQGTHAPDVTLNNFSLEAVLILHKQDER